MDEIILFLFLAVFPFGQLLGHWPIDFIAGLGAFLSPLKYKFNFQIFNIFGHFFYAALFSYLLSVVFIGLPQATTGLLYLIRLFIYWFFLGYCCSLIKNHLQIRPLIFKSLIAVAGATAIFGWIQYIWQPDLTALKFLGWDDHLYRLVGSFLDPGFTGLIIVFGVILSLEFNLWLPLFFTFSLAFTYSRASYLAFLFAMFLLLKKSRRALYFILFLGILVIILPKPAGEGVNLIRINSISARISNYQETLLVFSRSPLFGIGFNNICFYKSQTSSHSCSGSDSSLLLVLATTGIVGLTIFLNSLKIIYQKIGAGPYKSAMLACALALLVHSLFTNSLFYPWIMGFMAFLLSLQNIKEEN